MTYSTQPHTHMSSRETSFFSPNTFAKWAYTYLRILLNTGTLASVSNSPVLWNKPLCSPYSSLSLMGSMSHRVRGTGNWLREGREIVKQGGDTGQERWQHWDLTVHCGDLRTTLWSKKRWHAPCSGCNKLLLGCTPSLMTFSASCLSLWGLV